MKAKECTAWEYFFYVAQTSHDQSACVNKSRGNFSSLTLKDKCGLPDVFPFRYRLSSFLILGEEEEHSRIFWPLASTFKVMQIFLLGYALNLLQRQ
jgi:hypothetical protein